MHGSWRTPHAQVASPDLDHLAGLGESPDGALPDAFREAIQPVIRGDSCGQ